MPREPLSVLGAPLHRSSARCSASSFGSGQRSLPIPGGYRFRESREGMADRGECDSTGPWCVSAAQAKGWPRSGAIARHSCWAGLSALRADISPDCNRFLTAVTRARARNAPEKERIQRDPVLSEGASMMKVPFGRERGGAFDARRHALVRSSSSPGQAGKTDPKTRARYWPNLA